MTSKGLTISGVTESDRSQLDNAAKIERRTLSNFVLKAALDRANEITEE